MATTALEMPPYSNNSNLYIIPSWTLAAIALPLVVLRIYSRLRRTRSLFIDDWLILVAEPLSLVNLCLGTAAVAHGWGKPVAYISPDDFVAIQKLSFALQTVWIFTLCLVRLSVACSLLRFGMEKSWRYPLYALMTLQILISSSYVVIQFGQCTPISWSWEQIPAQCWDIKKIIDYGWAIAAIYVVMDLVLSLLPIRLIRTLNRSISEKILISFLMALGLLATIVCGLKMTTFNSFGKGDPMQETIKPSLYAKLEELVGIIASSLPCLKSPAEHVLKRAGLLRSHQLTRPSFVNTVPLPEREAPKDQHQRSDGLESYPTKDEVRVDSLNVKPGSSDSANQQQGRKESWHAV